MKLENLSDKDLEKIARNIATENKRRANRKAAATAIIAVLRKYKLSINDIPELKLENRSLKNIRGRATATKAIAAKSNVKNPKKPTNVIRLLTGIKTRGVRKSGAVVVARPNG